MKKTRKKLTTQLDSTTECKFEHSLFSSLCKIFHFKKNAQKVKESLQKDIDFSIPENSVPQTDIETSILEDNVNQTDIESSISENDVNQTDIEASISEEGITQTEQQYTNDSQVEDNIEVTNSSHSLNKTPTIYDILRCIDTMTVDGVRFENFCCSLLKDNGFSDIRTTRTSGDYGVDILAKKEDVTYAIQCKCYSDKVGNKAVQEAFSGKSYYNCMVAAVLTNNYFTKAAEETAKANNVLLWDRNKLADFLKVLINSQNENDIHTRDRIESAFKNQLKIMTYDIFSVLKKNNILQCRLNDIDLHNNGAYLYIQLHAKGDVAKVEGVTTEIAQTIHSNYVCVKETHNLPEICLYVDLPDNVRLLNESRKKLYYYSYNINREDMKKKSCQLSH